MSTSTASKLRDVENEATPVETEPLLNQDVDDAKKDDENDENDAIPDPNLERYCRIGELPSVHKAGGGARRQRIFRGDNFTFTAAEAKFVQEAEALYHDGGDPNAFVEGVFSEVVLTGEYWDALYGEATRPSLSRRLLSKSSFFQRMVAALNLVLSVASTAVAYDPRGYASLAWAGVSTMLSLLVVNREFREAQVNRSNLLETISKLLPIVMDTFETDPAHSPLSEKIGKEGDNPITTPVPGLTAQPVQPEPQVDPVAVSVTSQNDICVENAEQNSYLQQPPTLDFPRVAKLSRKERVDAVKRYLQSGRFNLSKLDQKKFKSVIEGLLSSRSADQVQASGYIILGWFPRGSLDPKETLLRINGSMDLFTRMRKGIRRVRGWRRFISLKSLHNFGLYKCDINRGAHVKVQLSAQERNILSHFMLAYKASHRHPDIDVTATWTDWVQRELNGNKLIMFEGKYSLELIYSWSAVRLSIAVVTPTLFSFAVGLGYMIKTGDVSTAWTISSYMVTAAGAIVALLAILGTLKES